MAKYLIETDGGKYQIETEDAPAAQQAAPNATPQQNITAAPGQTGAAPSDLTTGIRGWPAGMPLPGAAAPPLPQKLQAASGPAPTISGTLTQPPATKEELLSALPFLGAGAMGVATGGMGFLPAVAGAYVGGTAGGGLEQLGRKVSGLNPPESFPEAVNRASAAGAEQAAYEAGGRAVGGLLSKLAPDVIYQKTLKPPGASQAEAEKVVQAGLNERIPLNSKAYDTVNQRISGINSQIDNLIANNPQQIAPSDYVANVEAKMDALRNKWGATATGSADNLQAIDDAERDFLVSHGNPRQTKYPNGQPMTVADLRRQVQPMDAEDAQTIKKATYGAISNNAWKQNVNPGLVTQIDKGLASAMRQSLEGVYPDIAGLNAREGGLIDLRDAVDAWSKREGNKPGFGLMTPLLAGGSGEVLGGLMGHGPEGAAIGAGLTMASQLARDPGVASRTAILLDAAGKGLANIPGRGGQFIRGTLTAPNAVRAAGAAAQSLLAQPQTAPVNIDMTNPFEPQPQRQPQGLMAAPAKQQAAPGIDMTNPFTPQAQPQGLIAPPPKQTNQRQGASNAPAGWRNEWAQMLTDTARRMGGLPFFSNLLHVLGENEGSGNFRSPTTVRSPAGAIGLMQVMPATGAQYGYSPRDLTNPQKNIDAAAQLANHLWTKYGGRPDLAMAAYNAGEGAVDRARGNIARLPLETQRYVQRGMQRWRQMGLPGG